jgi:polysaccharide pyruvyl transferase CsaB
MTKPKCVICGYYGQGNAGDEALLMSLLEMLPSSVKPIVISSNPQATQNTYEVESFARGSLISLLSSLGKEDIFIWGGGSLMQDVTSIRSPLYYAGLMALAQWRGLKTIAYAQGIGPLNSELTRWLTKQVLTRCDGISVRDQASANLLKSWNLDCKIAPDPVWALSSQSVASLDNLPSPRIAVSLRPSPLLTSVRLSKLMEALIDVQETTKAGIFLVPFQESKDVAIAQQIASALKGECQIIKISNPRELKGFFQQVDLVIGMRLHSLIMAASVGCCCFGLSYDPKVANLMKEINLPWWDLAELPLDSKLISKKWLETYHNQERLSETQVKSWQEKVLIHQQLLEHIINLPKNHETAKSL